MCGILGYIGNRSLDQSRFERALCLLKLRGPDNQSTCDFDVNGLAIRLGHTRLKIIDLSDEANQPYTDGDITICYNGEIYNHEEIRSDLRRKGVEFRTESDTEVIIKAYQEVGMNNMLDLLEGMFAFCILDKAKGKAFLVRDRVGIKPLYYFKNDRSIIFSSEVKAIKELVDHQLDVDPDAVAEFYYHRYVPEPKTIFKEIFSINPGEYVEIDIGPTICEKKYTYWRLTPTVRVLDEKDIIQRVDELLHKSVQKHLVSDVPVCFALSGGLDSSLLLAIAKEYKSDLVAYTIKRSAEDIDALYARKIAKSLSVEQKEIEFSQLMPLSEDNSIFAYYDVPIACSSIFSTFLLYKEISKEFKVAIIGDGGDELFGGYGWYKRFLNIKKLKELKLFDIRISDIRDVRDAIKGIIMHRNEEWPLVYKKIMLNRFSHDEINEILGCNVNVSMDDLIKRYAEKLDNIRDLMIIDFHTFLRYNLRRTDLSSMAHSVESRVPFLDHILIEFAYSIDPKLIFKSGELKYILKKVAERYLPKSLIYRPKRGFSAPATSLLPVENDKDFMKYIYREWEKTYAH